MKTMTLTGTRTGFLLGLLAVLATVLLSGCGSKTETPEEYQARIQAGNLTDWEVENGIGPIKTDVEVGPPNSAMAEMGKEVFIKKCATCHYLDMRKTGPPLRDVTKRRSAMYVMNQVLNAEQMGKFHPEGRKLVAQYAQFMTIQGITEENARQLYEFLRSEADKPALTEKEQPGFGVPPPPPQTTTPQ